MIDPLTGLNSEQRQAVLHRGGPLVVLAGPGSGKTRVITQRIAHRVRTDGITPHRILGITFTNRAANEMKTRLNAYLDDAADVRIGTFHWMCSLLLRRHIHRIGYRRDFRLLSPGEARAVMRTVEETRGEKVSIWPAVVSAVKNGVSSMEAARTYRLEVSLVDRVIAGYRTRLDAMGALDLDDLQHVAVDLLHRDGQVRQVCRSGFDEILVDEYQDTNPVQQELLKLLLPESRALTVVGDEDQAIYGWRQGMAGTVSNFKESFEDARVIALRETYRSSKHVLRAASSLIDNNRDRAGSPLRTSQPAGPVPLCFVALDESDEARWVAREASALVKRDLLSWSGIAVLYRLNNQARAIEDALVERGIPYRILQGVRFYEKPEVRAVAAFLRLALDAGDESGLSTLLCYVRGVGPRRLDMLSAAAAREPQRLTSIVRGDSVRIPSAVRIRLAMLARSIDEVVAVHHLPAKRVMETAMTATEQLLELDAENETLAEVGSLARSIGPRDTLRAVADRLALEGGDDARPGISLMSLHAAKGLEFDAVFLVGLEEGVLPHRRSLDSESGVREERRLCYVGVTRSRHRLYLSWARARLLGGSALFGTPSRFIGEMGVSNVRVRSSTQLIAHPRLDHVVTGERVSHARWGEGTVLAMQGEGSERLAVIEFDGAGRQRLQLCHAPLIRTRQESAHVRAG